MGYSELLTTIARLDSVQMVAELAKMKQVALKHRDLNLELEADIIEVFVRYKDKNDQLAALNALYDKSLQYDIKQMQMRVLYWIGEMYRTQFDNMPMAMNYFEQMKPLLAKMTSSEYPDHSFTYYKLGELYYLFRDYRQAIPMLRKAIEVHVPVVTFRINLTAQNTIGLIYREQGQLDSSDYYFRAVLEQASQDSVWQWIARANLAKNHHLRGEDNEAATLLKDGIAPLLAYGEARFVAGSCCTLAAIYLGKRDFRQAHHYIKLAHQYIRESGNTIHLRQLYPIESKYYAYMGQPALAAAFIDSAIAVQVDHENRHNALLLLQVEQQHFLSEQRAKNEELALAEVESRNYRNNFLLISLFTIVLLLLLSYTGWLYYQKRKAYHALAQRVQQWVLSRFELSQQFLPPCEEVVESTYENVLPDEMEQNQLLPGEVESILQTLQTKIERERLFADEQLTLEKLAKVTQIPKSHLSKVINQGLHINFKTYINEFRVREAVKLLSDKQFDNRTIDDIAARAGFADRSSFYRVFKKVTGLSPSEFKRNR